MNLKNTFKNKRVIITGHTGFKGTWLSLWLKILGAKVMGLSINIPSNPSHFKAIKKSYMTRSREFLFSIISNTVTSV